MKLATITGPEFLALFPSYMPQAGSPARRIAVRDDRYALPQLSWLRGEFRSYYRRELERLGLTKWSAGDNDCDNRADLYRVLAQVCKAAMHLGDGHALAVAYIEYFNVRAGGWHAINAAAVEGRRLVFIEPAYEAGSDVTMLMPAETASIRAIEV
jgi:hypothetical protein